MHILIQSSLESSNKEVEEEEKSKKFQEVKREPIDWKPQDKCYFCVDGKLLKVSESGEFVVESGPVQSEAELNKHVSEKERKLK